METNQPPSKTLSSKNSLDPFVSGPIPTNFTLFSSSIGLIELRLFDIQRQTGHPNLLKK